MAAGIQTNVDSLQRQHCCLFLAKETGQRNIRVIWETRWNKFVGMKLLLNRYRALVRICFKIDC